MTDTPDKAGKPKKEPAKKAAAKKANKGAK